MKRTRLWKGLWVLVLAAVLMRAPPAHADDITVTTTNDVLDAAAGCAAVTVASLPGPDGATSLREAMCAANNNPASDTIHFAISGCGGVCTIQPTVALPVLTGDGTTIDGYTQVGSAEATAGAPATLLIEIDGSSVLNNNGFNVASAGNVIRGLVINRFGVSGIVIIGGSATGNVISGNHIGTDAAGTADLGNGLDGVYIAYGAQDNTVGGDTPADRNVISGNGWDGVGIHVGGTMSNTVRGNYVGTDASGTLDRGNTLHGVYVYGGAHDNTVGPDNVISGNNKDGVRIYGTDTTGNTISGNTIGLAVDGTAGLGNGDNGVYIANGAHDNTIGPGNVISGNDSEGVAIYGNGTMGNVVSGNAIGADESGTLDRGNTWDGIIIGSGAQGNTIGPDNVISGNDGDGIRIIDSSTMSNTVSGNLIGTDGSGAADLGNTSHGVIIGWGAHDNTVGPDNVISGNDGNGIFLSEDGTTGNTVSGNLVGTDASGTADVGNSGDGILIGYGAQGNNVGPDNVISGNDENGVRIDDIDTMSNTVSGNYIGTDTTGTTDVGNSSSGIAILSAHDNTIGPDNVISGNDRDGAYIAGSDAVNNTVLGNHIGTDATGTADLGNTGSGVRIWGGAQDNTVGPDNVISGNDTTGVDMNSPGTTGNVVLGNHIGTDATGTADLGNAWSGVFIWDGAQDNTVGPDNVISGNGENGVYITGSDTTGNTIVGNLIGTDAGGTAGVGNTWNGVQFTSGARNNAVGPDNVISGNDLDGVLLMDGDTMGNTVSGNYIGTDGSGTLDLGNSQSGVVILRAPGNTIGPDNVISGNDRYGVTMYDAGTTGNTVSRNYIGIAADGVAELGNAQHGVYIYADAQDNTVGPDNVIAHNDGDGVRVSGASTTGDAITRNSIFANTLGIDLVDGANGSIAPPEILTTTLGSVHVMGTACPGCTVELFINGDADGEGETYVGEDTADASGAFTVTVSYLNDPYLTATATDAISGTSEFSAVFTATETGHRTVYLPITLRGY